MIGKQRRVSTLVFVFYTAIVFFSACGSGGGSADGTTQSTGSEIPSVPGSPESQYQNPDASKISIGSPSKPITIAINLPGTPSPMPANLAGIEIWRGPAAGFTINADGLGASGSAVKVADSRLELPSGFELSDTTFSDSGSSLVYNSGSGEWSVTTGSLADGVTYSYIIRYVYDKTPDNTVDTDFGFSSGVSVSGTTMFFAKPKDLNLFPSAKDADQAKIIVNWANPAGMNPEPDRIIIYRQNTPFSGNDISAATKVYENGFAYSCNKWTDTSVSPAVFDGSGNLVSKTDYYYYVAFLFSDPGSWGGDRLGQGITNSNPAVAGMQANQPENVFAMGDADVRITSINGNVELKWVNFPSETFYPNGKVIIVKGNGSTPVTLNSAGVEKFVVQYWGLKEAPGTMGSVVDPHPMNSSLPAEQQLPPAVLSGSNGYTYQLDLANVALKLSGVTSGVYSYAFYIVDDAGNLSLPLQRSGIACVVPAAASNVQLRRSKASAPADITVSYTLPSNFDTATDRVEIYYSTTSQSASEKGSGTELVGPSDNYKLVQAVMSAAPAGTYYFSVYTVFGDNAGGMHYAAAASPAQPVTIVAADNSVKISISQTSSKMPAECQIANTYNFDQTLTFTTTLDLNYGVIRYTTNGTEPDSNSTIYDPANKPVLGSTVGGSNTYYIRAKYFTDDGSGEYKAARDDSDSGQTTYIINYGAYDANFTVTVKESGSEVTPNAVDHFTRSANGLEVYVKYVPGCGETFSIYRNGNYKVDKTSDAEIGNAGSYVSSFDLPAVYNRLDSIAEVVAANQTAACEAKNFDGNGRDGAGGCAYRAKYFLKIAGRSYASDPASGHNTNLIIDQNVKKAADMYVVFPKLVTKAIDMWNRPVITPYLWVSCEPVVQVDVTQVNFFDNAETPADGVKVYFNVQYAEKDKPYRSTSDTVYWLAGTATWPWQSAPNFSEPWYLQATSGLSLNIVDTEPFTNWYQNPNVTMFDANGDGTEGDYFYKELPSVAGRAYYQIYNPWDVNNRIGTKDHYSEINDTSRTGYLHNKAFRTVLRFKVRAGNTAGFRNADNTLRSFEPSDNKIAAFDTASRIFVEGTRIDHASISDMPDGYRSYPIEVMERPQGWTLSNHYNRAGGDERWYEKYGVKWIGANKNGSINLKSDSVNKFFDSTKTRTMIFSHGYENNLIYELFMYQARPWDGDNGGLYHATNTYNGKASDYSSWLSATGVQGESGYEWLANKWLDAGYNLGYFHWNTIAKEGGITPTGAELKIWNPAGDAKMNLYASGDNGTIIADCVRSANVGMMMAQAYLDSFPEGYIPQIAGIAGHSLGNQVVTNATRKMIRAVVAGKLGVGLVPDRIDLIDPYWSNSNDWPGQTCRQYADEIHSWSITNGDDYDSAGTDDSKGIPIQWFRTTALTQPIAGQGNDGNISYLTKTNYQKIYDIEKYNGFVKDGGFWGLYKEMSGDAHSEAVWWYFRSIERTGDATDVNSSISARSQISHLFYKLNSTRDTSSWRWFEMTGGQDGTGGGRKTITTTDDTFTVQSATSGAGSGKPEYN